MKQRILFVDDEPNFLNGLRRMLRPERAAWDMTYVGGANEALAACRDTAFDLIVSDVDMPGKNGFELLSALQTDEHTRDIPVIILTGKGQDQLKRDALERGAADLLNKPVHHEDLIARIRSLLKLKSYQDELKQQNMKLDWKVRERTQELERSRIDIVLRLGKAAEYRDEDTGNHVLRVGCYCRALAEELGMDKEFCDLILLTGPLHDIGKIGVPDSILLKPGKLTDEEWVTMRSHSAIGANILLKDPSNLNHYLAKSDADSGDGELPKGENPLLEMAASIALTHHEKWNGKGYPAGLSGEEIPIVGRITALADVFDALGSDRPYKKAFPEEKVLSIIREDTGTHFDPSVAAAFEARINEFRDISARFSDKTEAAD
jgi:response regulator RpfG family c-di-GMP phosphodiesterase